MQSCFRILSAITLSVLVGCVDSPSSHYNPGAPEENASKPSGEQTGSSKQQGFSTDSSGEWKDAFQGDDYRAKHEELLKNDPNYIRQYGKFSGEELMREIAGYTGPDNYEKTFNKKRDRRKLIYPNERYSSYEDHKASIFYCGEYLEGPRVWEGANGRCKTK